METNSNRHGINSVCKESKNISKKYFKNQINYSIMGACLKDIEIARFFRGT